jgi:hypothetical protein
LTTPIACMTEYIVTGPTKRKPRVLSNLASATDSGVDDGSSPTREATGRATAGACDHTNSLR